MKALSDWAAIGVAFALLVCGFLLCESAMHATWERFERWSEVHLGPKDQVRH